MREERRKYRKNVIPGRSVVLHYIFYGQTDSMRRYLRLRIKRLYCTYKRNLIIIETMRNALGCRRGEEKTVLNYIISTGCCFDWLFVLVYCISVNFEFAHGRLVENRSCDSRPKELCVHPVFNRLLFDVYLQYKYKFVYV